MENKEYIGFKATDKNLCCSGYQYTLGEIYKHLGKLKVGRKGFHFCKKLTELDLFYDLDDSRVFIITHGNNYACVENVYATDTIKFLDEITEENAINIIEKYNSTIDMTYFFIFYCRMYSDYELPKLLLSRGIDFHTEDEAAFRLAAMSGHKNIVKLLVRKGADIHAWNDSALKMAAKNGHGSIVRYLVRKGADIHAEDNCALKMAAKNGHINIIKFFESKMIHL